MELNLLYYAGIVLFTGLVFGKIVHYFKIPHVTGYLIGGIIIGPAVLNLVPHAEAEKFGIVTEAALGFIAFSIGSEFDLIQLKKTGKGVVIIAVLEALCSVACVDLAMIFIFKKSIEFSIIIGAISAAAAPAVIVSIIRQYNAKGPLVDTLLKVVALDNAIAIVAFSISIAIAQSMSGGGKNSFLTQAILGPSREILGAVVIGLICGIILSFVSKKASKEEQMLAITAGIIFFNVGIARAFEVSTLISCMLMGATVINLMKSKKIFNTIDGFTPPIFIAFFTIAGLDLNISILKSVGLVGMGYILFRVCGKLMGAYIGTKLANSPNTVQKYLGFTLIPQAGVAIGLSVVAETVLPVEMGLLIKTIILGATVIYELVSPVIAKVAMVRAGEILQDEQLRQANDAIS